jgi:hypothetical protein
MGERAVCMGDWRKVLEAIAKMYPDPVDLAEACRHSGEAERMRRAVSHLVGRGLVDASWSPHRGSPELRLTEAGMAVAFGLACAEEDAHEAIAAREEKVLRDLDSARARGPGPPRT